MFYHTPDVKRYVKLVRKYRIAIILLFIVILAGMLVSFKPLIVSSEELFWLNESKAYDKTKSKDYQTQYISRLTIHIANFDQNALDTLYELENSLNRNDSIIKIDSLLAFKNIYNDDDGYGSSIVKTRQLSALNAQQIVNIISSVPENFSHFVDKELHTFYLYIYAKRSIDMSTFNIPFSYQFSHPNDSASLSDYLIYILGIVFSIVLLFRLLFKNYFASFIALLIIFITLVFTMAITVLMTGVNAIYLSMALIVVAVSLVDYLYFYYRWHVSQYQDNMKRALRRTINRNLSPALWTSFITVMGLGSLLFVDSIVVQHLSISVIAASTITYALNLTLLPALLSFFKVKHPRIGFARLGYTFAKLELHYNHKAFYLFLVISFTLFVVGTIQISTNAQSLFKNSEKSGVVTAKLPLYDLDLSLVQQIKKFENHLIKKFPQSIKVKSASCIIESLHLANYANTPIDESSFLEAKMFLELYGLGAGLIDEQSLKLIITFNPDMVAKTELLIWLEKQKIVDIHLTDVDSLLDRAKSQASFVLLSSLVGALILIGLVMGRIFRSKEMILIAFMVNLLPMIWFGFTIYLLGFSLSIEALIAMTITMALGSDASVHFAYKYFRSRFFNRSLKHSLEKMFFYAGMPVLIGSVILSIVFITLTFTSVHSLQLIGLYGAILMLFSLVTDFFILPVMLIAFDKYFTQRGEKYKDGEKCDIASKDDA